MSRVAREVIVQAPPERVFHHLVDPASRRAWVLNFDEEPLPPGASLAVGTRIKARRRDPSSRSTYEFIVTALDPGRRLAMEAFRNGERTMTVQFHVEPHPQGARLRGEQELLVKGLLRLAAAAMMPKVEAELQKELDSLRRVALTP